MGEDCEKVQSEAKGGGSRLRKKGRQWISCVIVCERESEKKNFALKLEQRPEEDSTFPHHSVSARLPLSSARCLSAAHTQRPFRKFHLNSDFRASAECFHRMKGTSN